MSNFGRWKTSFALETGSCWQSFLQNKQKFCEVWTWPKSGVAPLPPPPPSSSRECSPSVICSVGHFQVPKYFALLIAKPSCKNEFYLSMVSPIMALASHSASALKQTLGARLAGATRKQSYFQARYSRDIWWPWTCEGAFERPWWLGKLRKFAMFSQNSPEKFIQFRISVWKGRNWTKKLGRLIPSNLAV